MHLVVEKIDRFNKMSFVTTESMRDEKKFDIFNKINLSTAPFDLTK